MPKRAGGNYAKNTEQSECAVPKLGVVSFVSPTTTIYGTCLALRVRDSLVGFLWDGLRETVSASELDSLKKTVQQLFLSHVLCVLEIAVSVPCV